MLERLFHLRARDTSVRTEIVGGVTTFMTMAYILFVNPTLLAEAGMDKTAVLVATALATGLVSIAMGLLVNYPIALAPGMGLNAFFTHTVVIGMGHTWEVALGVVFLSGVLYLVLTATRFRDVLAEAIPGSLKYGITVGIGLFITLIGLKMSGLMSFRVALTPETLRELIESGGQGALLPTESIIELGNFTPSVLVTVAGVVLIAMLMARRVQGAMLIGIMASGLLSLVLGVATVPEAFSPISWPDFSANAFLDLDILGALDLGLIVVILTFTFVILFDSMGTLVGTMTKAGLSDRAGRFPMMGRALGVNAGGVLVGALLGTSPLTAYVESAAGVSAGARTGLAAVVAGVLFLLALFFMPLVALVPAQATAPALIIVGALMLEAVRHIDFSDATEYLPAFVVIVLMPFTYSIATGIAFGIVMIPLVKTAGGRIREVHPIVWVLSILIVGRYVFLP